MNILGGIHPVVFLCVYVIDYIRWTGTRNKLAQYSNVHWSLYKISWDHRGKKNSTIVDSKCERVLKRRLVQEKFLDMLASIPLKHCSELTLKGVLIWF